MLILEHREDEYFSVIQEIGCDPADNSGAVSVGLELRGIGDVGGHALVAIQLGDVGLDGDSCLGFGFFGFGDRCGLRIGIRFLDVSFARDTGKEPHKGCQQDGKKNYVFDFVIE